MNPTQIQAPPVEPEIQAPALKRAAVYLRVSTARQANKNGEAEGYSIPAQRAVCSRKAADLGAEVVDEYVDAGASARSADRPGLQELLLRLRDGDLDFVIVHKLDRLARDRGDDVAIALSIKAAGAVLISASEQIDETPAGMLLHGVMATIAEFYSRNLSNEAKKGIAEKARRGGTHGVAPLGYNDTLARVNGQEVKGVEIDEERADHIRWAFAAYATGNWSITQIEEALAERGLKSRTTQAFPGTPINHAQVHRMLTNPYYIGKVTHRGAIYDGVHEPLVSEAEFFAVQAILTSRRIAGERSWRHTHYLKGMVFCERCKGRMGWGPSTSKSGTYEYFFCLGHHTGRTDCDLPYIPSDDLEKKVEKLWCSIRFSEETIERTREFIYEELDTIEKQSAGLLTDQQRRLQRLERQKQKLIDAYLADAITVDDMKPRQAGLLAEMADAQRVIDTSQLSSAVTRERVDIVLELMHRAGDLYKICNPEQRKLLNQAMFEVIYVDLSDTAVTDRRATARGELSTPAMAVAEIATAVQEAKKETPGKLLLTGSSNVTNLAERARFELAVPLLTRRFSRPFP
jgi:site-specific DNA recombinase